MTVCTDQNHEVSITLIIVIRHKLEYCYKKEKDKLNNSRSRLRKCKDLKSHHRDYMKKDNWGKLITGASGKFIDRN